MAARKPKPPTEAELAWERRKEEIKKDAQSGINWASRVEYGPACICGAGQRTLEAAIGLKSQFADPKGECARHPGGTVWSPPEGLWETMRKEKRA